MSQAESSDAHVEPLKTPLVLVRVSTCKACMHIHMQGDVAQRTPHATARMEAPRVARLAVPILRPQPHRCTDLFQSKSAAQSTATPGVSECCHSAAVFRRASVEPLASIRSGTQQHVAGSPSRGMARIGRAKDHLPCTIYRGTSCDLIETSGLRLQAGECKEIHVQQSTTTSDQEAGADSRDLSTCTSGVRKQDATMHDRKKQNTVGSTVP